MAADDQGIFWAQRKGWVSARFSSTCTQIRRIQRLAWILCKDDMHICEVLQQREKKTHKKLKTEVGQPFLGMESW